MKHLHALRFGSGRVAAALLVAVAFFASGASAQSVPAAARSELAPGGKLRVGLLVTNTVFVAKDGSAAEMRGVAVDLSRELAKRLGATFEPVRYDSVGKLIDGTKAGEWDIAFLGFEKERAAHLDFTAPYLELPNTFVVPAGSPIKTIADIDKPGHRIGTADRSAQDVYLTRTLKQAQLVRTTSGIGKEGVQLLSSGKVDAVAGNRITVLEIASKVSGSRVLDGQFNPTLHTLAVAKGRPAGLAYAKEFIEQAKAGGMVQKAIDAAALRGVTVAAAGK